MPDYEEQKKYILRNPVHTAAQISRPQSLSEANTTRVSYVGTGINHVAGGWPKEINTLDEEAVSRFLRRVERDEDYVQAIFNTRKKLEHAINQNNAVELYQMYFSTFPAEKPVEKYAVGTKCVYKDPKARQGTVRPVSCIAWTIEESLKLVVSYCDRRYPIVGTTVNTVNDVYVWDVENPSTPHSQLIPPSPCWQVACSPADPNIIVGGLEDGRVCLFDIRNNEHPRGYIGDFPVAPKDLSPHHLAHRSPVSALIYIQSRTNTEFFSGSSDGQCMWWDIRSLSKPTDKLIMAYNIPSAQEIGLEHGQPVSALQFDRSFPTRFLCGTDTGLVLNVNRKGKTTSEIMSGIFHAHLGPVKAVHRSPLTSKMFITCGDWTTHIWSDEVHISPIITGSPNRYPINDVCWAPHRISAYINISSDGKFRIWDLLRKYNKPVVEHHISRFPLLQMKIHNDGRFVAVGDTRGRTYLINLQSDCLVYPATDKDKGIMTEVYERETKREHILENRIKEIRLKLRTEEEGGEPQVKPDVDEEGNCKQAEYEYFKIVQSEGMNAKSTFIPTPIKAKPKT
ncbi:dynein intermediate chain 3, ciliary [Phthorimaea operculella]|nr:dynein intermediate chain 3, ciliary [Phthorimaea operculella]